MNTPEPLLFSSLGLVCDEVNGADILVTLLGALDSKSSGVTPCRFDFDLRAFFKIL